MEENTSSAYLTPGLLQAILKQYGLPWNGVHGVSHWARVLENGRRLAALAGARPAVVALFAVFHDSRRQNEGWDPGHGARGAALAAAMRGRWFDLADEDFELLRLACAGHTDGHTQADVTIQTCWDADRLDLFRVRTAPDPARLCTPAARLPEMLAWANQRAARRAVPALVQIEWGLDLPGYASIQT